MQLLLTSAGLSNKSIVTALKDLAGKPFDRLNLTFIPTAANLEPGDKWWLIKDLETCQSLKFKSIDIVDISALPKQIWLSRLEACDILLFEGGNTFHLMYWIVKSGLKDLLPELLKNRIYIGISAGSIVATPSLVLSSAEKEPLAQIGEEIYEDGLKLVNFIVEPHINNSFFPENTFGNLAKRARTIPHPIYALDDNSAVSVNGSDIKIISEGKWQKYN